MNTEKPLSPSKPEEDKNFSTKMAILLVLEFGIMIIIPLIIFTTIGKWLEGRYHSRLFLFASLILALLTSSVWVYRKINDIYQKFTK